MNFIKSTNFSYLGDRSYVHSTSIIKFIHDNISVFVDNRSTCHYLDIKMHKEMNTNCRVDIYSKYHEYVVESVICEVILKSDEYTKFIYFLSNHKPVKQDAVDNDNLYSIKEISSYGKFSGSYRISSNSYSEYITNIIQSNKLLHLKNLDSKRFKILNIFMKNVPVEFSEFTNTSDIEIKNIGIRDAINSDYSTLNSVKIAGIDIQPILIGFQVKELNV